MEQPRLETQVLVDATYLDELATLFGQYRSFYNIQADRTAERQFLTDRLRLQDSLILAGLDHNQRLVGFAQVYFSFSSLRLAPFWVLNDLFVAPDARGQGVGRVLLTSLQTLAHKRGASGIMLDTSQTNTAARALYESEGFEANLASVYYYWYTKGSYLG